MPTQRIKGESKMEVRQDFLPNVSMRIFVYSDGNKGFVRLVEIHIRSYNWICTGRGLMKKENIILRQKLDVNWPPHDW